MSLVSELELPAFDHTEEIVRGEDFHAAMAALRQRGWLAQGPFGYIVLDRESGEFFLRSRAAIFPGMKIAEIFGVTQGAALRGDEAEHPARQRPRPLASAQPGQPGALTAGGRALPARDEGLPGGAAAMASAAGARTGTVRCDFVEAFAKPYPSQVIAAVMGAPLGDAPRLHHWSNWIQRQFDAAGDGERAGSDRAGGARSSTQYAEELVAARRDDPGDDLISLLIAAEEEGDRLSDVECINLVFNVLAGGVDTTQSQLAHAVRLLAEHPEQWRALRADPGLAEAAVEEALRFEPITPFTARILTEEVVHPRREVPRGDDRDGVCVHRQPRPRRPGQWPGRTGGLRYHRPAGTGAPADVRGGRPLLPRGEPRPAWSCRRAFRSWPEHVRKLELDGEAEFGTVSGIYGLERLPVALTL